MAICTRKDLVLFLEPVKLNIKDTFHMEGKD